MTKTELENFFKERTALIWAKTANDVTFANPIDDANEVASVPTEGPHAVQGKARVYIELSNGFGLKSYDVGYYHTYNNGAPLADTHAKAYFPNYFQGKTKEIHEESEMRGYVAA